MQHLDIDLNDQETKSFPEIDSGPIKAVALRLIYMFIFMALGAMFYSSNTETLDNCRAIYSASSLSAMIDLPQHTGPQYTAVQYTAVQ